MRERHVSFSKQAEWGETATAPKPYPHPGEGSTRSSHQGEGGRRRADLSPPAAFLAALLLALAFAALVGGPSLPFWARLTGPALVLAGMALHRAATRRFHAAATTVEPEGLPSSLVVDGPFGHTRNPMYLAGTIILVGVALAVGDYASMMVPPLWAAAAGTWFIAEEERTLGLLFGSEYHAYRERVRRWI